MSSDWRFMGLALDLARRGLGRTAPNPAVGAVVVRDGEVIAEGWTQPPGRDHAEPHALKQLGGKAEGATMYVTLEPCCHWGRTPPCTEAIVASGIRRVVVGTGDPFPLVAGKGLAALRADGIEVEVGLREAECRRLNVGFIRAVTEGLPEVTLKAAVSLDGRTASAHGTSKWITGPAARDRGHRLRDTHDAVVVGVGTVIADDPSLTTRIPGGRDAVPVVLDTRLRTPPGARVLAAGQPPIVFSAVAGELPRGEVVRVPEGPGGLDVVEVMKVLAKRGHHRVLVEGGARVHRAVLDAGLVDRVELFVNARVLAGGPGIFAGPGFALAEAPGFRFVASELVGDDLHVTLERECSPAS
ncbi:MAG: bifunctional diaminohydroxyphosphoribosylaminopyrimidine deaminase/5-amino-6-(5-phosphoribosylamino)uracil reductase RibD [Myxococcota bacterium]